MAFASRRARGSMWLNARHGIAPIVAVYLLMLLGAALGLHGLIREVDRSDAQRATEAVSAAFNYQFSRLEMVTLNNAVYTEAWKAVGRDTVNKEWALENWTVAPPDLPGHHGILLVENDGTPVVGTQAGKPMSQDVMMRMAALASPVVEAMIRTGARSKRQLVNTGAAPIMIAAASVVPEPSYESATGSAEIKRHLVLFHPINQRLLDTMNETIGGEQLRLGEGGANENTAVLPAQRGDPISLSWRSRRPGQAAMIRSLNTNFPLLVLVTLFFLLAVNASLSSSNALMKAAKTDFLTKLPNRAAFSECLETFAASGRTFYVGLIDLDGFKQCNDKYGHLVGDEVLQHIGMLLRTLSQDIELVARLGGDEFGVIASDENAAQIFARRLQIELSKPSQIAGNMLLIGASVGIAQGSASRTPNEVLSKADADLYKHKQARHSQARSQNAETSLPWPTALPHSAA